MSLVASTASSGAAAFRLFQGGEAQPETKGAQKAIQRVLRRVVSGVDRPQDVGARHPDFRGKLLDAHRPDHFPECLLDRHAVIDCGEKELASKVGFAEVLR